MNNTQDQPHLMIIFVMIYFVNLKFFYIIFQCIIFVHLLIPNEMINDFQQKFNDAELIQGIKIIAKNEEYFKILCSTSVCVDFIIENINNEFDNHSLLICYPSILYSPKFIKDTESRQTQRFKINMKNGMCGNCEYCNENENGIKWHMVELKWTKNELKMRTSLLNGSVIDLTEFVYLNFNGDISKFFKILMKSEWKEERDIVENNELIESGAFLEDLIADSSFNYFYYLKAVRMDLAKFVDFIEKNPDEELFWIIENKQMNKSIV